jgi:putative pyruvate formate lyase activating enzyme
MTIKNFTQDDILTPLTQCRLCGHACGADRMAGNRGLCGAGDRLEIARSLLHHGEEPPISGTMGSGALFFSRCPLSCVFCQNHQISQDGLGRPISVEDLAGMMIDLEAQGAHNINLVSPTPWVAHIAAAIDQARERGLKLPIVYNTGGFDSPQALDLMAGRVDVYLPDAKMAPAANEPPGRWSPSRERARELFGAANYAAVNRAGLKEMFRQVGHLTMDEKGLAKKGILVRHLVLPENLARTDQMLAWLAGTFGPYIWISLMAQYRPMARVLERPEDYPTLTRPLAEAEYEAAMDMAVDLGLENVFVQELSSTDCYVPDFKETDVFSTRPR